MTKLQKNRNFICNVSIFILYLLELAFLLGAYFINTYTRRKLGVLRHIVYLNGKWENEYPLDMIKFISLVFLSLMILMAIIVFYKYRNVSIKSNALLLSLVSVFTIFFIVTKADAVKAYYMICLSLLIGSAINAVNLVFLLYRQIKLITKISLQ